MRSPRRWVPVLGWLAATATSIALASIAMMPVLRTATDDEGTLVSIDQLQDVNQVSTAAPSPAPAPSEASSPTTEPSKSSSPSRSRSSSPTPAEKPDDEPEKTEEPDPTTPATGAPQTSTEDGWTVTTSGDAKTFVRSFKVEGGKAVIRASAGTIELVTATPSDGYAVQTVQNSPDNLAVYFNEVNHSFIIHVVWQDGKPVAQVSEVG